jgi:hypothetical protein
VDKIKELFKKMNQYGIPLPMIRVDGKPSITATFAFISFNTALLGQIGKVTKILGTVDLDAANYLFFGCLFAYLGRRMTADKGRIEFDKKEEEK